MREREDGIEGEMERTKTRDSEQSSERAEDGKMGDGYVSTRAHACVLHVHVLVLGVWDSSVKFSARGV